MKDNRNAAIAYVMDDEGGWNPADPSNCGITLDRLKAYCQTRGLPVPTIFDLQKLSQAEKIDFYNWLCDRIAFDVLPHGVDYAALDCATNEGEAGLNAIMLLTHVLVPDTHARIQAMSDIRIAVKRLRPQWSKYGPGWSGRIATRVPQRAFTMMLGGSGG